MGPAPGAAEPEVRPPRVKGGAPMELFPGRRLRGAQPVQPAPAGGGQEASIQVSVPALQRAQTHMCACNAVLRSTKAGR
jgi:hypothetical protein